MPQHFHCTVEVSDQFQTKTLRTALHCRDILCTEYIMHINNFLSEPRSRSDAVFIPIAERFIPVGAEVTTTLRLFNNDTERFEPLIREIANALDVLYDFEPYPVQSMSFWERTEYAGSGGSSNAMGVKFYSGMWNGYEMTALYWAILAMRIYRSPGATMLEKLNESDEHDHNIWDRRGDKRRGIAAWKRQIRRTRNKPLGTGPTNWEIYGLRCMPVWWFTTDNRKEFAQQLKEKTIEYTERRARINAGSM